MESMAKFKIRKCIQPFFGQNIDKSQKQQTIEKKMEVSFSVVAVCVQLQPI